MEKLKVLLLGLASLALAVSCYHLETPGHGEPREEKDIALQLVKVSEDTITVVKEFTFQLKASFYPDDSAGRTVTWKSLDTDVASVDGNGLVTGMEFGRTHVVIISESGLTDSCVVNVLPNVHVESVVVEPAAAEVFLGETLQLSAKVLPEDSRVQDLEWTTDNPAVATVNEKGKVTAVTEGTATVTATSVDRGKTATCAITVSRHAVTGVTLNIPDIKLAPDGQVQLRATVEPANATYPEVTWSTSDASVATVSETGLVKAVALGTATITVTTVDGGFQATCAVTVAEPSTSRTVTLTFDLSSCPASMAEVSASIGTGDYDLVADDGNTYSWRMYKGNTAAASYSASGYLVLNLADYFGTPVIPGGKLVSFTFTQAASTKTNRKSALTSDVHDGALQTSWFDASAEANGASVVTGTKGEDYTYTVVNPVAGARYYLVCANSGIGVSKIVLTYELEPLVLNFNWLGENRGSWPTTEVTEETPFVYPLDGTDYTFLAFKCFWNAAANRLCLSVTRAGSYFGLPVVPLRKLSVVSITRSGVGSANAQTSVIQDVADPGSKVPGGDIQSLSDISGTYTFNLPGTEAGKRYYLYVDKSGYTVSEMVLTYE